jgi:hypothetical protein
MSLRLKSQPELELPQLTLEVVALVVAVAVERQLYLHRRQLEQLHHQDARKLLSRCAEESDIT